MLSLAALTWAEAVTPDKKHKKLNEHLNKCLNDCTLMMLVWGDCLDLG
jgi:hypothetical protein